MTLAQLYNPVLPEALGGKQGWTTAQGGTALGKIVTQLIGALFIAGFLLAFLQLIIGGISWITSGGDKAKLEKSRDEITNAIVGIIIVSATYAVGSLIAKFFGLDLTALPIPSIGQ